MITAHDVDLELRQVDLYTDVVDIWDVGRDPDQPDTPLLVARGIPAKFLYTPNVDDPSPGGRIREFRVLTTDILHLPITPGFTVPNGGIVVDVTPGSPSKFNMSAILGDPQIIQGSPRRPTNVQEIQIGYSETPPVALLAFYELPI